MNWSPFAEYASPPSICKLLSNYQKLYPQIVKTRFPYWFWLFLSVWKKKNADTKQNVAENYDKNIVRGDV